MLCETCLSGIEKLQDLIDVSQFFGGGESYYILMTD